MPGFLEDLLGIKAAAFLERRIHECNTQCGEPNLLGINGSAGAAAGYQPEPPESGGLAPVWVQNARLGAGH